MVLSCERKGAGLSLSMSLTINLISLLFNSGMENFLTQNNERFIFPWSLS